MKASEVAFALEATYKKDYVLKCPKVMGLILKVM